MYSLNAMNNHRGHWGSGRDSFLIADPGVQQGKTKYDVDRLYIVGRGGPNFDQCRKGGAPVVSAHRSASPDLCMSLYNEAPECAARALYCWSAGGSPGSSSYGSLPRSAGNPARKKPAMAEDLKLNSSPRPRTTQFVPNFLDGLPVSSSTNGGLRWIRKPGTSGSPASPVATRRGQPKPDVSMAASGAPPRRASPPPARRGLRPEVMDRWLRETEDPLSRSPIREFRGRSAGCPMSCSSTDFMRKTPTSSSTPDIKDAFAKTADRKSVV